MGQTVYCGDNAQALRLTAEFDPDSIFIEILHPLESTESSGSQGPAHNVSMAHRRYRMTFTRLPDGRPSGSSFERMHVERLSMNTHASRLSTAVGSRRHTLRAAVGVPSSRAVVVDICNLTSTKRPSDHVATRI